MKKRRLLFLDFLKIFSCLAVILTHVLVTARTDFPDHGRLEEAICKIIPNLLHFAVPVFFMITGYLFLSKKDSSSPLIFFKKYTLKYIIAVFSFGFVYAILEEVFSKNITPQLLPNAFLNTVQGRTWEHMWYLYSLVGVLLFMPILKNIKEKNLNLLKYFALILTVSSIIAPSIKTLSGIRIGFDLLIITPYLLYTILGYLLGEEIIKIKNSSCILTAIICGLTIAVTEYLGVIYALDPVKIGLVGSYYSPIILLYSACIFCLFKNAFKDMASDKFILKITEKTYGIYLVHMFWINLLYKYFHFNILAGPLFINVISVFAAITIISYINIAIFRKLPLLKRIV